MRAPHEFQAKQMEKLAEQAGKSEYAAYLRRVLRDAQGARK